MSGMPKAPAKSAWMPSSPVNRRRASRRGGADPLERLVRAPRQQIGHVLRELFEHE